MFVILVPLLVLALIWIYKFFLTPLQKWKEKGVKHMPPVPFFGSIFNTVIQRESITMMTKRIYDSFPNERYCGLYQFQMPVLMIRDPELVKTICIKEFDKFHDHNSISKDADPMWSKNLVAAQGEQWHNLRTTLSPIFTGSKMRMMFELMHECGENLVNHFAKMDEEVFTCEMKDVFSRFTNDAIASCAFGVQCNSLKDRENDFYMQGIRLTDLSGIKSLKFFGLMYYPKLMKLFNVRIFSEDLANFFHMMIKQSINLRKEKGIIRPDLIQILQEASKSSKYDILGTDEDITAQALIFFFAGFEAASTQMTFLAYELALNPDIQERLRKDLENAISESGGKLSYDVLMKNKYLDMVVSEVMRKWPAASMSDRVCTEEYTIQPEKPNEKPLKIEVGTLLWIPQIGLLKDPKYFEDPEKFDPERFSDENKSKIDPSIYIPFGLGPRICIGNRFALMELKLMTAMILSRFEFVPVKKTPIPFRYSTKHFMPYAEGGMWLGLKRRHILGKA